MKTSAIGIAVLAILFSCPPVNAEDLTDAEITARDFTYQGVGIGTTLQEFKIRFPNATLNESDKSFMTSRYSLIFEDSDGLAKFILASFFREKMYKITIAFNCNYLSKIGGISVVHEKMVGRFGLYKISSEDPFCEWVFPSVQRTIRYGIETPVVNDTKLCFVAIYCWDTDIMKQVMAIKIRKLNLGF